LATTTGEDTLNRITTHPGEILRDEFMRPLGLSANALARALDVPPNRTTAIIAAHNPRAVTPDTALRLARYFDTTPQFWLNLQQAHELSRAVIEQGARINDAVRPRAA
jgi:addiction module HigA family antidote